MPARRFALAALALAAPAFLAACDSAGTSPVTGVWEGTAHFEADTLLPDHNVRVTADYDMTFRFELVEDEGLVTGQIAATSTGQRVVREAGSGFPADTARFDGVTPRVHELFGTYLSPVLEVDVPGAPGEDAPYEEDLWTFNVRGGRAEIERVLLSNNHITLRNGEEFELVIRSDGPFAMRRVSRDEPPAAR